MCFHELVSGLRIPAESKLVHFEDVYKIAEQSGATRLIHGNLDLKLLPDSYMVAVNTLVREKSLVSQPGIS